MAAVVAAGVNTGVVTVFVPVIPENVPAPFASVDINLAWITPVPLVGLAEVLAPVTQLATVEQVPAVVTGKTVANKATPGGTFVKRAIRRVP